MAETPKKTGAARREVAVEVRWSENPALDQISIDEMFCQLVNDRAYLTLGQLRFPMTPGGEMPSSVEIRPVAKLVLTHEKLRQIVEVLGKLLVNSPTDSK